MSRPTDDPLRAALEIESGRAPSGPSSHGAWREFAARLLRARQRLAESPPCPRPVLRRAQGIFQRAPQGIRGLLRLVFDSWSTAAVATRGADAGRLLAYAGEEGRIDLHIAPPEKGRRRVDLTVSAPTPTTRISLRVGEAARGRVVALDEAGGATVRLPAEARQVTVVVRVGRRERMRTPVIPLE